MDDNNLMSEKFSKLLELSEKSRARKFIFGLQINIDKTDDRRYDVTRYMVHRAPSVPPLISVISSPKLFEQVSSHSTWTL